MELTYLAIWIGLPVVAGFIAHKKGRSWISGSLLTLLVPPLGILAVLLQSPAPSTGRPRNMTARMVIGLLPLWAAIVVVVVGSFISDSRDYGNVAPWLIVAAIPACVLTLGLLEVVLYIRRARTE